MGGVALRRLICEKIRTISDERCSSQYGTGSLCGCLQVRRRGESEKAFVDCVFQLEYERQRYRMCVRLCAKIRVVQHHIIHEFPAVF